MNNTLKFGTDNAKLTKKVGTFSIPAGHTCPFALKCLSKANVLTGKIKDGKHCEYRCYAASIECRYPIVRKNVWRNYNLLRSAKTVEKTVELINSSLPTNDIIRVHVHGDFYNERYFVAWLNTALNNPSKVFYGYTKAIPYLVKYKGEMPKNFRFTASFGGTHDNLIKEHNLKSVKVVNSIEEAKELNLPIDHDDSHAIEGNSSFLLYLHGMQPKGSLASKQLSILRNSGITGYNKSKSVIPTEKQSNVFISMKMS